MAGVRCESGDIGSAIGSPELPDRGKVPVDARGDDEVVGVGLGEEFPTNGFAGGIPIVGRVFGKPEGALGFALKPVEPRPVEPGPADTPPMPEVPMFGLAGLAPGGGALPSRPVGSGLPTGSGDPVGPADAGFNEFAANGLGFMAAGLLSLADSGVRPNGAGLIPTIPFAGAPGFEAELIPGFGEPIGNPFDPLAEVEFSGRPLAGFAGLMLLSGLATGLIGRGAVIPVGGKPEFIGSPTVFPFANELLGGESTPPPPFGFAGLLLVVGGELGGNVFGSDDGDVGCDPLAKPFANGFVRAGRSGNVGVGRGAALLAAFAKLFARFRSRFLSLSRLFGSAGILGPGCKPAGRGGGSS